MIQYLAVYQVQNNINRTTKSQSHKGFTKSTGISLCRCVLVVQISN